MSREPGAFDEEAFERIEAVLLYVSDARERAEREVKALADDGADDHLVEALRSAERELASAHRTLMQRTFFAVPRESRTTVDQLAL